MEGEDLETTWKREFGEWNEENLETHGVIPVSNAPFVFVIDTHPVIGFIRQNASMFSMKIDDFPKDGGMFYKLSHLVLTEGCKTIRAHVFSKKNKAQTRPDVSESETVSELHDNAV